MGPAGLGLGELVVVVEEVVVLVVEVVDVVVVVEGVVVDGVVVCGAAGTTAIALAKLGTGVVDEAAWLRSAPLLEARAQLLMQIFCSDTLGMLSCLCNLLLIALNEPPWVGKKK